MLSINFFFFCMPSLYRRQFKVVNRTLFNGLKKKLDQAKGLWVKEVKNVLGAYIITKNTLAGEISFALMYGTEVVISIEIAMPNYGVQHSSNQTNDAKQRMSLDLLEEFRETTAMKLEIFKRRTTKYYNVEVGNK